MKEGKTMGIFSRTTIYSTFAQTDSPANQGDIEKQKACY